MQIKAFLLLKRALRPTLESTVARTVAVARNVPKNALGVHNVLLFHTRTPLSLILIKKNQNSAKHTAVMLIVITELIRICHRPSIARL